MVAPATKGIKWHSNPPNPAQILRAVATVATRFGFRCCQVRLDSLLVPADTCTAGVGGRGMPGRGVRLPPPLAVYSVAKDDGHLDVEAGTSGRTGR
jgi:hypothetical protein